MGLAQLLDQSLTLQRPSTNQDSMGGATDGTFENIATSACTTWPASAQTKLNFSRRDLVADYEICTASDIGAQSGDRIQIGSTTYTVLGAMNYGNAKISNQKVFITVVSKRNQ